MTYLFVGAGQAGGAIVDAIFERTDSSFFNLFGSIDISNIGQPLVFNSTVRDLENLSNIAPEQQYGIADSYGIVPGTDSGLEEQITGGFGRNPVRADEVMERHSADLHTVFDEQLTEPVPEDEFNENEFGDEDFSTEQQTDDIQFAFLFLGLGGGTGCGIGPHIAREIKAYDQQAQVIAVAVLPNTKGPSLYGGEEDEDISAGRQAWNARFGLDRLEETVDGIILVDNQRISHLGSSAGQFSEYNEYVASAIYDLIAGPVVDKFESDDMDVDTPDIDVRDIATAVSFGTTDTDEPGYATIGRSATMTQSIGGYLIPYFGKQPVDGASLARIAAAKQTLDRANVDDAQKAITLIRAPESYLTGGDRAIDIAAVSDYLRHNSGLGEVNLGVSSTDRHLASVTTVLTYRRSDLDRIEEIHSAAEEYEDKTEAITA